jgi:hypothetical protein
MKLVAGNKLTSAQVSDVKRSFTYRLTTENGYPERNPCGARIPAVSDAQWIEDHAFWVNVDGTLTSRKGAEPAYMLSGA